MTYILLLIIISTILSYLILKFIYKIIFKSTKSVSRFLVLSWKHRLNYNALGIYTGKNDHSIKPLVNTLYFYSYLLELDANYNKVKDKSLSECIEYLNHFMKNIQIYTETFVLKNNATNKNSSFGFNKNHPEKINHFEYSLSLIATIMQETNGILEELGDSYYTSYKVPIIS